jgi:hypothetical protein
MTWDSNIVPDVAWRPYSQLSAAQKQAVKNVRDFSDFFRFRRFSLPIVAALLNALFGQQLLWRLIASTNGILESLLQDAHHL